VLGRNYTKHQSVSPTIIVTECKRLITSTNIAKLNLLNTVHGDEVEI